MSLTISPELVASLERSLGDVECPGSAQDFAAAIFRRPESVLRYHRDAWPDVFAKDTQAIPYYRWAVGQPDGEPRASKRIEYFAGDYFIQDPGSLLALNLAGADGDGLRGKLVLDLCASPGGKSTALTEAVGDTGFVLANEVIGSRLAALSFNLTRTGSSRYAISRHDPEKLAEQLGGIFDVVLVDAPCSGQALLGRGKQSDAALKEKPIMHSAARQNRILDAAISLTRPGGTLVYSTCTFATAENEAQIARLVGLEKAESWDAENLADYQTTPGCYRTWPHRDQGAGSFAARLRVLDHGQSSSGTLITSSHRSRKRSKLKSKFPETFPDIEFGNWHDDPPENLRWLMGKATWVGFPHRLVEEDRLSEAAGMREGSESDATEAASRGDWLPHVACDGPAWAYQAGKTWRPAHGTARRRKAFGVGAPTVELDDEQTILFAAGHPVPISGMRGWRVATWRGRTLGWLKFDGRQGKNYLPSAARDSGLVRTSA